MELEGKSHRYLYCQAEKNIDQFASAVEDGNGEAEAQSKGPPRRGGGEGEVDEEFDQEGIPAGLHLDYPAPWGR